MSPSPPLAGGVLLLAAVLAAFAAGPAAAAASGKYGGGRMVIIHAPTRTPVVVGAGGTAGATAKWHYRRVEDEVAPEFGGGGRLLAEGNDRHLSYDSLIRNKPSFCPADSGCAAKGPGGAYTGRCNYKNTCPHTPSPSTAAAHA